MEERIYRRVVPFLHEEAEAAFASKDAGRIEDALLGLAYYDPDWKYVRELAIKFLTEGGSQNKGTAAMCFGHLARIHGNPELKKDIPLLKTFLNDPEIGWIIEDVIDQIRFFTHKKRRDSKD